MRDCVHTDNEAADVQPETGQHREGLAGDVHGLQHVPAQHGLRELPAELHPRKVPNRGGRGTSCVERCSLCWHTRRCARFHFLCSALCALFLLVVFAFFVFTWLAGVVVACVGRWIF